MLQHSGRGRRSWRQLRRSGRLRRSNIAPESSILEAIDYAITTAHVNVLNESFVINNYPDDGGSLDLIAEADDQAVAAGITVVESTGDAGATNTTGEAATDPNVISVGGSTDNRNYIQDGFGGTRFPEVKGWSNDEISSLSSSGFDQRGRTIDVVAPGESGWALCSTNLDEFGGCASLAGTSSPVQSFGATSQSSPFTAGVAALVIEAYEKTHAGRRPRRRCQAADRLQYRRHRRSRRPTVRVFDVLVGWDAADPLTYVYSEGRPPNSYLGSLTVDGLAGLRIGVVRNAFGSDDDANAAPVNRVIEQALHQLQAGGATLLDVENPRPWRLAGQHLSVPH